VETRTFVAQHRESTMWSKRMIRVTFEDVLEGSLFATAFYGLIGHPDKSQICFKYVSWAYSITDTISLLSSAHRLQRRFRDDQFQDIIVPSELLLRKWPSRGQRGWSFWNQLDDTRMIPNLNAYIRIRREAVSQSSLSCVLRRLIFKTMTHRTRDYNKSP